MKVFVERNTYDERFPETSRLKRIYKESEEGVRQMCEIIERNRREAAEEAAKEATFKQKIKSAKDLIKSGIVTFESIKSTGLYTAEELAAIQAN